MEHGFGSSRNKKKDLSLMNGEKKHITIPRFIRREPKNGTIRG
jgi:hypothetical protein